MSKFATHVIAAGCSQTIVRYWTKLATRAESGSVSFGENRGSDFVYQRVLLRIRQRNDCSVLRFVLVMQHLFDLNHIPPLPARHSQENSALPIEGIPSPAKMLRVLPR